jgi:hypothetical protein
MSMITNLPAKPFLKFTEADRYISEACEKTHCDTGQDGNPGADLRRA